MEKLAASAQGKANQKDRQVFFTEENEGKKCCGSLHRFIQRRAPTELPIYISVQTTQKKRYQSWFLHPRRKT